MNNYQRICYYKQPKAELFTATMQYLVWFKFFVRNADDFIKVPTPDSKAIFPTNQVRLFYIMRSTERTHVPCTYTINTKRKLTYIQWREVISSLQHTIENEINKTLKLDLYARGYLEWHCCEFIGWTSDGLVQNPEEDKQAFCFEGHLT